MKGNSNISWPTKFFILSRSELKITYYRVIVDLIWHNNVHISDRVQHKMIKGKFELEEFLDQS